MLKTHIVNRRKRDPRHTGDPRMPVPWGRYLLSSLDVQSGLKALELWSRITVAYHRPSQLT